MPSAAIWAAGDGPHDVAMLDRAARGIAMPNAGPAALAAADQIAPADCDHDGPAPIPEHLAGRVNPIGS